jgi:hypothetical protein
MTFYTNNDFPASVREIVLCMLLDVTYRIGAGFIMGTGDLSGARCLFRFTFHSPGLNDLRGFLEGSKTGYGVKEFCLHCSCLATTA